MPVISPASEEKRRGGRRAGAGRKRRGDWQAAWLKEYRRHGKFYIASDLVGVDPTTVRDHMAHDAWFAEQVYTARELYADRTEEKMEALADRTGNPVGYIVRLKALRPSEYIERQVSMTLTANVDATPGEAKALLAQLAGNVTPATLEALREPLAIPATVDTGRAEGTRP